MQKTVDHTPGPWAAEPTMSTDFVTRRIRGPNDEMVCDVGVPTRTNLTIEAEIANARLIASAPDLLAGALEAIAAWDMEEDTPEWNHEDRLDNAIGLLRAAVAKATGGP